MTLPLLPETFAGHVFALLIILVIQIGGIAVLLLIASAIEKAWTGSISGTRDRETAAANRAIAQMDADVKALFDRITAKREEIALLGNRPPDGEAIAPLQEKAAKANAINTAVRMAADRNTALAEATKAERAASKATATIEACDTEVDEAIANADLPVPGLTLGRLPGHDDMIVMLDGLPFDQASDAMRLRVSMAIGIALNPSLRVLRIRDGSLLDHDAMDAIRRVAKDNDWQFWIERVNADGPAAIIIENGRVKE